MGARGSEVYNGYYGDVLIILRGPTSGERAAKEGFLIGKWGF